MRYQFRDSGNNSLITLSELSHALPNCTILELVGLVCIQKTSAVWFDWAEDQILASVVTFDQSISKNQRRSRDVCPLFLQGDAYLLRG